MKILIVRVGRTGDMVMCTPALSALLKYYPNAKFTFLTSDDGKRILGDFSERIEDFWIYNRKHLLPFAARRSINRNIVKGKFDHIYCFESNPAYHRLFAGSKARIHGLHHIPENTHYSQALLDVVSKGLGRRIGFHSLHLRVKDCAVKATNDYLESCGITGNTFVLALHPTFSGINNWIKLLKHRRHKFWPVASFGKLGSRLRQYAGRKNLDLRIVMNLMPDELKIGKSIVQHGRGSMEILSPEPDIQNYMAFLKRADLLVVPDTGPLHIAAAVGTHVIALFSGKSPKDCGPFARPEQSTVLRSEDTETPEKGIAAISVDSVYHACVEQMELSNRYRVANV